MRRLDYEECRNQMVSMIMNQDYPIREIQLKSLCDYCYAIGLSEGYAEGHSDANNGIDKRHVAHTNSTYGGNS